MRDQAAIVVAALLLVGCADAAPQSAAMAPKMLDTAAAGVVEPVPVKPARPRQPTVSQHDAKVVRDVEAMIRGITHAQFGMGPDSCEEAVELGVNVVGCDEELAR